MQALAAQPCDVLVTDYTMAGGKEADGLAMIGRIRRRYPALPIVLLTMSNNLAILRAVKREGVLGFIDKHDVRQEGLQIAVRRAYHGRAYVSSSLQELIDSAGDGEFSDTKKRQLSLSPREMEVLRLLGAGLTVKQIAQQSQRSISTISRQKGDAMHKLGLEGDAALFEYLREGKL